MMSARSAVSRAALPSSLFENNMGMIYFYNNILSIKIFNDTLLGIGEGSTK